MLETGSSSIPIALMCWSMTPSRFMNWESESSVKVLVKSKRSLADTVAVGVVVVRPNQQQRMAC
jgi:hypothetical protein